MTKLNSHTCDCIVIGGGAAGMMSAVCASQGGASTTRTETDMSIPIRKRRLLCSPHCGMKSNRAV